MPNFTFTRGAARVLCAWRGLACRRRRHPLPRFDQPPALPTRAGGDAGLGPEAARYTVMDELPFDFLRRRLSVGPLRRRGLRLAPAAVAAAGQLPIWPPRRLRLLQVVLQEDGGPPLLVCKGAVEETAAVCDTGGSPQCCALPPRLPSLPARAPGQASRTLSVQTGMVSALAEHLAEHIVLAHALCSRVQTQWVARMVPAGRHVPGLGASALSVPSLSPPSLPGAVEDGDDVLPLADAGRRALAAAAESLSGDGLRVLVRGAGGGRCTRPGLSGAAVLSGLQRRVFSQSIDHALLCTQPRNQERAASCKCCQLH